MRAAVRPMGLLVGVLLVYYAVPLRWADGSLASVLLTVVGAGLLGWAMTTQIRRHVRGEDPVGLPSMGMLLILVVLVFALGHLALQTGRPGEFENLRTKTDSLYFTLQVLSTVGLGDVYPVGQAARILVSLQMAFDLVFVAAALSVIAGRFRDRVHAAAPGGSA